MSLILKSITAFFLSADATLCIALGHVNAALVLPMKDTLLLIQNFYFEKHNFEPKSKTLS